jgi:hypothetical protein
MPFHIVKKGSGYYVENATTHRKLSNHPLSSVRANKQLIAVNIAYNKGKKN